MLLSSVMLRQNPHNVHEWHKRVKLFQGSVERQIQVFTEALRTVDVEKVRVADASLIESSFKLFSWEVCGSH